MTTYSMSRLTRSDTNMSAISIQLDETEDVDLGQNLQTEQLNQHFNEMTIEQPANPLTAQTQEDKDIFGDITSTHRSISAVSKPYQTPQIIQAPVSKQTINNIEVQQINKIDYSTLNNNSNSQNTKSNIKPIANSDNDYNKLKSANSNLHASKFANSDFNLKQYGQPQFI